MQVPSTQSLQAEEVSLEATSSENSCDRDSPFDQ